jgi:glutaredoxin
VSALTIYGKPDCVDFLRTRALLDRLEIPFEFHDIMGDRSAASTAERISGGSSSPVIVFGDGSFQVEPTDAELAARLGFEPPASAQSETCDTA